MKPRCGDLVHVHVVSTGMSHFETDFEGHLGRTYHQQFGDDNVKETIRANTQWTIFHPMHGPISWYNTCDFKVIKHATEAEQIKWLKKSGH